MIGISARTFLLCVWIVTFLVAPVLAQESQAPESGGTTPPDVATSGEAGTGNSEPSAPNEETQPRQISTAHATRLSYALSVSEGQAREDEPGTPYGGPFTILHGRLALILSKQRYQLVVGAAPMVAHYSSSGTSVNGVLDPSIQSTLQLSRRWSWNFGGALSYGEGAYRVYANATDPCAHGQFRRPLRMDWMELAAHENTATLIQAEQELFIGRRIRKHRLVGPCPGDRLP
jgi:hypothetical protein